MPIHGFPGNVISATPPSVTVNGASGVFTTEQQMQYQAAGNWPMPLTQISRSLRFNSADSAYLSRTPASASNRKTWTWSGWVKRSALSSQQIIFSGGVTQSDSGFFLIAFALSPADSITITGWNSVFLGTTQVFRDVSAWYHIVVAVDTTNATADNRVRLYVNGSEVTTFTSRSNPSQNADFGINQAAAHGIGQQSTGTANYFNGYLTEVNFIDGLALTPASFGVADQATGVWGPRQYTGPYGTNGFYLNFSDNSGTTSTTLGKDYSGNGNNWTPNNFSVTAGVGNDSLVDTPTPYGTDTGAGGEVRGNYATLNPLNLGASATLANGNLDHASTTGSWTTALSTIGMASGKWYFEATMTSTGEQMVGIANSSFTTSTYLGANTNSWSYYSSGVKYTNASSSSYGASYTNGDVIGVALDMDAGTVTFYKNGSSQGQAYSGLTGPLFFGVSGISSTTRVVNFGQRPFAYTAPSGFKALCTQNLPTPTIGATSATRADDYFNTLLWTGNGNTTRSLTGVGFTPDFVWIKERDVNLAHTLYDVIRGTGSLKALYSSSTASEAGGNADSVYGYLSSFDSDGFSVERGSDGAVSYTNKNNGTYVAWNWKANGAGVTNTAGTITSTVSANTTAGFSIVTYTGNGTSGATVGHGLGAVPQMIIAKTRNNLGDWPVYHASLGNTKNLLLNTGGEETTSSSWWNNTTPTSTLVTLGNNSYINGNTYTFVMYCFTPVAGYSAFGSYLGNFNADGPFIYTGFRPAYVLFKITTNAALDWVVFDNKRNTYNLTQSRLFPSLANAEADGAGVDFLSNGFKLRTTNDYNNGSSYNYIYAAFAEFPFKYTLAR